MTNRGGGWKNQFFAKWKRTKLVRNKMLCSFFTERLQKSAYEKQKAEKAFSVGSVIRLTKISPISKHLLLYLNLAANL